MPAGIKRLYEFGPFRLDIYRRVLLRDGEIVPLSPKVVDLLQRSGRMPSLTKATSIATSRRSDALAEGETTGNKTASPAGVLHFTLSASSPPTRRRAVRR